MATGLGFNVGCSYTCMLTLYPHPLFVTVKSTCLPPAPEYLTRTGSKTLTGGPLRLTLGGRS